MRSVVASTHLLLGFLLTIFEPSTTMGEQPELMVVRGNSQFSTNMYKVLSQAEGNVFFSPISAHAVLSMAYQGAQGSTAAAFSSTLNVPHAKAASDGYNVIMNRLNSVQDVTLHLANKIFLMEGNQLLEEFKQTVTKGFLSDVQLVNFAKNVEAAKTINDWVELQTKNKIKDLLEPSVLNELTRLVLVNAIYFKGDWLHKFNQNDTQIEPFYLNDQDSVNVDMMHLKKKFRYLESSELDAKVLELPYKNENLSMVIILPNQRNGIANLEQKLVNVDLANILQGSFTTEVEVSLPKFKIETTIDLEDTLKELGLGEIFDEVKANFRGMIPLGPSQNLFVSKVIQKAFIEVNEEGAEAAAATAMVTMMRCSLVMREEPKEFTVDHPFIFLLTEKSQASNPLFVGRISKLDNK